ncbi:hypothetical protein PENTCL1PPCAC_5863, partial [Pristionchus entomophagus]
FREWMLPLSYRPLSPFKVSSLCSFKSVILSIISLYFAAHFLAFLYSIFAVLDEKRTLEKKELYDGPLVLNDKYKNVLYGKKVNGVYTNVGVMNTALLFDQPTKDRKDEAVPTITDKFYETLSSSVKSILARQYYKKEDERFVYFTFVNDAYSLMTMNWLCNVDAFEGILNRTIIATSSSTLCATIRKEYSKVDCIKIILPSTFSSSLDWGKKEYIEWLIMRTAIMKKMIELSIPFVLFETDAVWFRDPSPLFEQASKVDDVDIKVPVKGYTGRGQSLSFDPMLVYPTNGSLVLFKEMNKRLTINSSLYDQDILDDLCHLQFHGVVCRTFEWKEIADGKWFKLSERERARYEPYIVNNNYYVGVKNKMTRQAMNHMWLLNPKSNSCSAARRRKMFEENEALARLKPQEDRGHNRSIVDSAAVL